MEAYIYKEFFLQGSYQTSCGAFNLYWNKTNSSGIISINLADYKTNISIQIGDEVNVIKEI